MYRLPSSFVESIYMLVNNLIFGRPFVKRFALCYRTVACLSVLSCLSVTLVYCSQTIGWIKMKLGMEVGLGQVHIVLDGNPAPPQKRGAQLPIFDPCLLWPNGWMDQHATWYRDMPQPRRHCVRWNPAPSPEKRGHSTQFSAHAYCGQTAVCIRISLGTKVGLSLHCVRWGPSSPSH